MEMDVASESTAALSVQDAEKNPRKVLLAPVLYYQ
jgi:hypothetical protein